MSCQSNHRAMILCALLVAAPAAVLLAGDVAPPAGPVAPTHKTLTQVEPRIPISAATTPGDADSVYRIALPGSYYLTDNISNTVSNVFTIEIAASDVQIDLCGFVISGGGDGVFCSIPVSRVRISNGTVRNMRGAFGVNLQSATHVWLDRVTSHASNQSGIAVGQHSAVRNCVASSSGILGFSIGPDSLIENCQAIDNNSHGIVLESRCRALTCISSGSGVLVGAAAGINVSATAHQGLIQNCFLSVNNRGIILQGTNWTVINNVANGSDGPNYLIGASNYVGPIVTDPALAGPMSNLSN